MEFKDKVIDYINQIIKLNINLIDYANHNKIPIYVNNNYNKGWKGHVIEHMLNIQKNSSSSSDYENLEIKTVPIKIENNNIKIMETTCLNVINANEIIKFPYKESQLYNKINKTLFILLDVGDKNFPKIHSTLYIDFKNYKNIENQMERDYNELANHILDNINNEKSIDYSFNGKIGKIIQPRPKTGTKNNYSWAFYLKKEFLTRILNKSEKVCYFFMGLPGTGKSTYINEYIESEKDIKLLSTDNLIYEYASKNNLNYHQAHAEYIDEAQKQFNLQLQDSIKNGKSIIWDQTNLVKTSREKKINNLLNNNYKIIGIYMDISKEEWEKRISNRELTTDKHIPKGVLKNMYDTLDKPSLNEMFDELYFIDDNNNKVLQKEKKLTI